MLPVTGAVRGDIIIKKGEVREGERGVVAVFFFLFGLSLLLLILLADYVKNRFRHTSASRRVLAGEAVLCLAAAYLLAGLWRVTTEIPARLAAAAALFFPLYLVVAFVTVEYWRYRKQGGFDREIARLVREWRKLQDMVDRLGWELRDIERELSQREEERQQMAARMLALQDQVQAWEQVGDGITRLIKIEQWASSFGAMNRKELAEACQRLQSLLQQAKGAEREELAVQLQVAELTMLRQEAAGGPESTLRQLHERLARLKEARQRADQRLQQIRQELASWQERKTAFLRKRISLD